MTGFSGHTKVSWKLLQNSFSLLDSLTGTIGCFSFYSYVLKYIALPLFWPFNLISSKTGMTRQDGRKLLWVSRLVRSIAQIS